MIKYNNYDLENEINTIEKIQKAFVSKKFCLNWYGAEKCIRTIYKIPEDINIEAFVFHGVFILNNSNQCYEQFDIPILCTRKAEADYIKSILPDRKDVFYTGGLMPMYRKLKKIKQSDDAKGTIAFPAHSTYCLDPEISWEDYADKLLELPEKFQPVHVCMYYVDILKGRHKAFLDKGISVYTAGHKGDYDFCDNFYEIIRHHKYATSNVYMGSHLFYTAEFGLPTFIYGNEGDEIGFKLLKNFDNKVLDSNKGTFMYMKETFPSYPTIELTKKQLKSIRKKMGLDKQSFRFVVKLALLKHVKKVEAIIKREKKAAIEALWQDEFVFKSEFLNKLFRIQKLENKKRFKILNVINISFNLKGKKTKV